MDWKSFSVTILLIELVSPANASNSTTTEKSEELKTSSPYQVTENIEDIPDDRSLPPIIRNFTLVRPLNYGNNTLAIASNNANTANNNNFETVDNNNIVETSSNKIGEGSSSEETGDDDKKVLLKKNSFSILHIKAEYDARPVQSHGQGIKKLFGGIKDYVYSIKKGVVNGLHSFFHADADKIPEKDFHDKFHRNFHGVGNIGHFESVEDLGHDDNYHEHREDSKDHFKDSFEEY